MAKGLRVALLGVACTGLLVVGLVNSALAARPGRHFVTEDAAAVARKYVVNIETLTIQLGEVTLTTRTRRVTRDFASGIIYTSDGYILTVARKVQDVDSVRIYLDEGIQDQFMTEEEKEEGIPGQVVHADNRYDIAIIKIDKQGLPVPPFAPISTVSQGDIALAIGNSAGFGSTVTLGIVSAIRNVTTPGGAFIPDAIQTDATINPGNDGGGLFNWKGELMGMHIIATGLQNTNFFMNSDVLRYIADQIIENVKNGCKGGGSDLDCNAFNPYLGIEPWLSMTQGGFGEFGAGQVPNSLRMTLGLPDQYWDVGLLVNDTMPESPARNYGINRGDFLVDVSYTLFPGTERERRVEKEPLRSTGQLLRILFFMKKDQPITFGVIRNDKYVEITVPVGDYPRSDIRVSARGILVI